MLTSIATVSLSGGLDEKLEAIAAAKFDGVEIFENDLLSFNGTPAEIRRIVDGLGLRTVTFQPFRDFEGMPAAKRDRVFQRAERKFDTMQELGCDLLMVCSNVAPDSLGGIDRAAADLHALGERAARRGLRVGFEALAWGRHIKDYRDAWEAVRRADHPAVGLVLDSFHTLARKTDLTPLAAIPGDRIFLVQLADAPMMDMDYLSWSRHLRNCPGQGELPVLDFMQALQATGYAGFVSLEIFNDQFRGASARSVAVDGRRSLIYLLDELARKTGLAVQGASALPPKARCLGTEFVEFALDETAAAALERMLAGLGFHKAGRHRSKAVTRWRQGGINIVVNTDKEGFAHAYTISHGAAVCAIGLKVDDAAAALDRACRLLDQPFRQAVGPGELEIPAVRGLGGSLIYFVDAKSGLAEVWDIEFEPCAEAADADGAGLTGIDHISQSLRYPEMLSWLLFYTSLLDMEKTRVETVADPRGLVKSQVVQSPDGSVRIVLNASEAQGTLSSRFLSEAFGSGVQHIAFATDDILATAAKLRAGGVAPLAIPENYYDDLEARTDLAPETIAALKAHGILYDRDGEAEYLQAYTQTFEERFFFEIVERRAYRGFGAANAPIRLAAQTRAARHPGLPRPVGRGPI
ncbi:MULTISPECIES: sugar phosphate isomerase/epimerase and 4-hydroxyphenylpyruvate domain-containing protein [Rhodomicrobium]|uniref:bifunctional sugar phosphate isomerase/epimerase/4-hydroxyphenylpyruvate dioxygenase family protein n=1 Tax=Rhodomicrobium TaxID=1068 RepID=UPI000B4BB2D2|nr:MULTISPECIES: sugar phosphate isomerase/epimerase and 4-hydroxyphenylpyruvate domain-containing protein [Rhodomicrobium]